MFLTHGAVKVGGGKLFGVQFSLTGTPVHEEAVAQSPEHAHDPHGLRMLDTAAVVVVRDVEALMQTAFDAPACAIQFQPAPGIELLGSGTGDQSDFFGFAAAGFAQEPGRLAGEGKEKLLGAEFSCLNAATFLAAFILFHRARLGGARCLRGKNPPQGHKPVFGCSHAR